MKRIGFDLRCLPTRDSSGAGIAHAAKDAWIHCSRMAAQYGIECVGFALEDTDISEGNIIRLPKSVLGSGHALSQEISSYSLDAFFSLSGAVPLGVSLPSFVWVHDVAIFDHPDWFPQSWLRRQFTTRVFLRGLKRASHIFCVSEDTRQAVIKLTGRAESEVSVTLEGVDVPSQVPNFSERLEQVVILGTVEPRKNISFIAECWPEVCRRLGRTIPLVVAGQDGWGQVDLSLGQGIERRRDISDIERDRLLQASRLVLVPSLYEGFGRVVLEAMAQGAPVIASHAGAHPEVVGEAGMLLAPLDRDKWIEGVVSLLSDEARWRQQQTKGRVRAQEFGWERAAGKILAVVANYC